jgi:hypothetical protein
VQRLICIVEKAQAVSGKGVVVTPRLAVEEVRAHKFEVSLLRPDGTSMKAIAHVSVPGSSPPSPRPALMAISDVGEGDVPPNTEVWVHEEGHG